MTKLPNKSLGEVYLPEAGEGAFLQFTVDAMERFHGELGDDYLFLVTKQLGSLTPPTFLRTAVETMLNGGSVDGFPWGIPFDELKTRCLDAVSLALNGKLFSVAQAEAVEEQEREFKKKLEKVKADPTLIPLYLPDLISTSHSSEEVQQDSDSEKSEATPSSTSIDSPAE